MLAALAVAPCRALVSDGHPGRRRLLKLVQLLLVVGAGPERPQLPEDALLHGGERHAQVGQGRRTGRRVGHTLLQHTHGGRVSGGAGWISRVRGVGGSEVPA